MTQTTHLPVVFGGPSILGQGATNPAYRMFELIHDHPEQQRKGMVWDKRLAEVARDRCYSQAMKAWTGHIDSFGHGPNRWVHVAGYRLPPEYLDNANNIESLSHHGDGTPEQTFEGWLNSPGHRIHILGLDPFYAAQTFVGVGYYAGGEKQHYWSVISCPPEAIA